MTDPLVRPTQLALYFGAGGIVAFTPFAALVSPTIVTLQLIAAALTFAAAVVLGRQPRERAVKLMMVIAPLLPASYGPVVALTGGAAAPTFAWLVAMPLALVVIFREHVRAIISGSVAAVVVAVAVCLSSELPAVIFALRVMQVAVAAGLAVAGGQAFAVSGRRERAALKARQVTSEQLAESELKRERAERRLYLVKLTRVLVHEVNNPLACLKANIEVVLDGAKNHDDRDALTDALDGVYRICDVMDQLKGISGQATGEQSAAQLEARARRRSVSLELPRM
jgi:signal transduction histidine kinase